ncbi:MAG: hypothetical protein L0I76_30555 [Pseudonocardia sp.]|nr:hypothetical protein [Pseudonocardia sp.]
MTSPKRGSTKPRRMAAPNTVADERIRQERAYQLRLACMTFQEIADSPHPEDPARNLYAGPSEARRAWLTARDRHAGTEETADARREWTLRNERIFRALYPRCLRGDLLAIDRYQRLFAEHARMLGLYQDKIEVTKGETDLDKALRELREQMDTRAAGQPVPEE